MAGFCVWWCRSALSTYTSLTGTHRIQFDGATPLTKRRIVITILLGFILGSLRSQLDLRWWILLPWGIGGLALGYGVLVRQALIIGALYGFFLLVGFLMVGYPGDLTLMQRLPGIVLAGLVGSLFGVGLTVTASILADGPMSFVRRVQASCNKPSARRGIRYVVLICVILTCAGIYSVLQGGSISARAVYALLTLPIGVAFGAVWLRVFWSNDRQVPTAVLAAPFVVALFGLSTWIGYEFSLGHWASSFSVGQASFNIFVGVALLLRHASHHWRAA